MFGAKWPSSCVFLYMKIAALLLLCYILHFKSKMLVEFCVRYSGCFCLHTYLRYGVCFLMCRFYFFPVRVAILIGSCRGGTRTRRSRAKCHFPQRRAYRSHGFPLLFVIPQLTVTIDFVEMYVLTAAVMKRTCSPLKGRRYFGGTCSLHPQQGSLCWCLTGSFFSPENGTYICSSKTSLDFQ
jgi:hypothetical protein